jgi:hypothetical protein
VFGEPSDAAAAFSERLLLLPPGVSYMCNDHASLLAHALAPAHAGWKDVVAVLHAPSNRSAHTAARAKAVVEAAAANERRARRNESGLEGILRAQWKEARGGADGRGMGGGVFDATGALLSSRVVLASFSNFMKMDPAVVGVWAAVLRRCPLAVLWLQVPRFTWAA